MKAVGKDAVRSNCRTAGALRGLAMAVAILGLAGCASIMHGTTQGISISSAPTGAQVAVNNVEVGTTPVVAELKRKDQHVVQVMLDGYEPFEMALNRSVSGWVWGNIVFGGIIGLAVDAATGGLYKLSPEQVRAEMAASGAAVGEAGDGLWVRVTLVPVVGAERVGEMTRAP